jgi:hypothetical protein
MMMMMVVGLEINAEETKNMCMSYHQNAGQNCNIKVKFRYLRLTVTNQNYIHKKVKNRLNFGNA